MLRDLITTSHEISKKALDAGDSVGSILDEAEQSIFNLSESKTSKIYEHIDPILNSTVKRIEEIAANPGSTIGVPSGLIDLDKLTAGFQKGDLIVIAGRPSMGKTALALTIARNAAIENNSATAIFSLEMSSDQLGQRLLTSEAKVDNSLVRRGSTNIKWKNINIAAGKLSQAPLYIDDTPALSILDLKARARRLKRERDIELIVVDYLQLMQGPKNAENRQNEISQITQSLKALAKELNIPVIALSQLSRAVEQRTKKEPILSDLRESGAIEQDADVVIFLYRPAVYDKDDQELKGIAYLIVAKQRNGPTGRVTASFIDTYARFDNHTEF